MKTLKVTVASLTAAVMLSVSSVIPAYASDTTLDAINNATQDTIATAVTSYLTEIGRDDVYSELPDCDQTTINELLLEGAPYADEAALATAYQTAIETATQADRSIYNVFVEDFSSNNLETNEWTYTNLRGYIGTDKSAVGAGDMLVTRKSLNISGNETSSFMFVGSSLRANETGLTAAKSTITKTITNPKSIVTLYMAVLNEPSSCVSGVQFNDTMSFRTGGTSFYATTDMPNMGGAAGPLGDTQNLVWNKITLDGIAEDGKVKAYLNNEYLYTYNGTIERIEIGSLFDNAGGYSVVAVDNISIATEKSEAENLADFNAYAVTESRLKSFIGLTTKSKDVFASLVECDRNAIVEKIEAARPYDSIESFETAYQKILEDVTGKQGQGYTVAWQEDFDNGLSSEWVVTGTLKGNSVGTGDMTGLNTGRYALDISGGDQASAGFVGASLNDNSVNYITRTVENPQSIVTLYFFDYNNEINSPRMFFGINDTDFISRTDSGGYYSYQVESDGNMKLTSVSASKQWHKVVFDGVSEKGYVNAYLDGVKVFRTANDIEYVRIGNKWNNGSYSVMFADHITVAEYDAKAAFDTFNSSAVTADSISKILPVAGKSDVFGVLPTCDKTAIAENLEKARPFADIDTFAQAYQKELENVTGKIGDDYTLLWQEDFDKDDSDDDYYSNNWDIGGFLRGNAIGEGNMTDINIDRQYLNISGTDTKSAGFVSASLTDLHKNYITRTVSDSNSVVTLYFNDAQNDGTPSYYFKINDNDYIGRSNQSGSYYSYWINGEEKHSQVEVSKGWHKVVFDGTVNEGLVTAYIDGAEVFQTANEIEYISVGNHETYNGFDVVWVDHITVVKDTKAADKEQVKVTYNGIECNGILPQNAEKVTVSVENAKLKTDYVIAAYDSSNHLTDVTFLTKDELATVTSKDVNITNIKELRIFAWNSIASMTPARSAIILSK